MARAGGAWLLLLSLCAAFPAPAEDLLDTAAFSLRFPAAFSHFSPFADVAGKGGASAASPFGSSSNLAGIAWSFQPEKFDFIASANYDFLSFDAGTEMNINTQTLAFDAGGTGVFRAALLEFQSNTRLIRRAPVAYEFDLVGGRLDWSKRFGEDYGLGAGAGFTHAETRFSTPALRLSDSEKDNWTFRLSGQRRLGDRWLAGVVADYGSGGTDFERETARGSHSRAEESSSQWVIQTGLAYLVTPKASAHLDYQFSSFSQAGEDLTLHRISLGSDMPLTSWLMLRVGGSTDQWGNFGWSGGVAVFPRPGASVHLACQNGMFPELEREFGNAQMLNLSLSLKW